MTEQKRDYASTQVNLASFDAASVLALASVILDEDLAEAGRETTPHITVKYGLHHDDPGKVRRVLAGEPPVTATLGAVSYFECPEYDVVKIDVESPDLHRLNTAIADAVPHTDTHPVYKPHVTLAYVKPGRGVIYAGRSALTGRVIFARAVMFCRKDGTQIALPLTGKTLEAIALGA